MKNRLHECLNDSYDNRIAPFFWLHWEDDSLILDELDKVYQSGIRAVCLESRTHDDFCRDGWWDDIKLILRRCKELGMKVWILDEKRCPSGSGNGSFADKHKELRHYEITEMHIDVVGPMADAALLANEWKKYQEDEILGAVLCRRNEVSEDEYKLLDATDISHCIHDGTVYLDIPEGYWRVVLLMKTRQQNNPYGDFADTMNPLATDVIIEEIYEPHFREIGEYFGNTFLGFFSDEPGFQNNIAERLITPLGLKYNDYPWNHLVEEELKTIFGNKIWEKMVNIFFEVEGECRYAREAYMDVISKLYNKHYSGKLAAWCHVHNIMYIGHVVEDMNACTRTGDTAANYFRALEGMDMAGVDVVLAQILPGMDDMSHARGTSLTGYSDYRFYRYTLAKLASSMANTNNRMNGRAMCEIFGAYGWVEGTKMMKWLTDFMLVRGINYFVPHAFSPKENDTDCPPNFYARGTNPQYKFFKNIMAHMNRCSHLLTEGKPVRTCGVLYDTEIRWNGGDMLECDKVAEHLLNNQIDFDYICHDYLLEAEVSSSFVKIGPSSYDVILVPYAKYMPKKILAKIAHLKESGVRIIWIDNVAEFTSEGEKVEFCPAEVVSLDKLAEFFRKNKLNDIEVINGNKKIKFCHRKNGNSDLYMFVNENIHQAVCEKIRLTHFAGGNYVVYDAFTNEVYRDFAEANEIELYLEPYQSLMVFTGIDCQEFKKKENLEKTLVDEFFDYDLSLSLPLSSYKKYGHLTEPFNITGKNGIRNFSGFMKYSGKFVTASNDRYLIDLGTVGETAEVFVNGKKAGERICPPYTFEITDFAEPGENNLEIIVSNTLVFKERDIFSIPIAIEPSGLTSKTKLYKLSNKK